MNAFLSTASPSLSAGEVVVLFWATIGGIAVFVGLLLEKFAEWMNDRFLGGRYKPHKTLESVGWCMLMVGIFVEITVAFWSANDAWQTRQMAIKNDPFNRPILDISATVQFRVNKTDFSELPRFGNPIRAADLWLMQPPSTNIIALNGGRLNERLWDLMGFSDLPILSTDHSISFPNQKGGRTYFMQFRFDEDWATFGFLQMQKEVKELNHVNVLRISVKCLPHDLEVLDGSVKLIINDSVIKIFQIPQQKDNREDDKVPDIYSNTTPFVILAYLTNSPAN